MPNVRLACRRDIRSLAAHSKRRQTEYLAQGRRYEPNTSLPMHSTGCPPVAVRTTIEHSTASVGPWRAGQFAASSSMQIEHSSDANAPIAFWGSLGSAGSRSGVGRVPQQDFLHAEVCRLAAENYEIQRTAVHQAAFLRQQGHRALHHQLASFEHAAHKQSSLSENRSHTGTDEKPKKKKPTC